MAKAKMTAEQRLQKGLLKANGNKLNPKQCWKWTNSAADGYGLIGDGQGGAMYAHRLAYELKNGPIPDNLIVSHSCNVKNCANPSHLMLATPASNSAYMVLCGRQKPHSDKKPRVKMSQAEKLGIIVNRLNGVSYYAIGKQYGRYHQHVKHVYENWLKRHSNDLIDLIQEAQNSIALNGVWT